MEIRKKHTGQVCIITLSGKLLGEPETTELQQAIDSILQEGCSNIVLDLKNLLWMGSTGLGIIIAGLIKARRKGGDLRLCGLNKKVIKLLEIAKMNTVFRIAEDVENTVQSFSHPAGYKNKQTGQRNSLSRL